MKIISDRDQLLAFYDHVSMSATETTLLGSGGGGRPAWCGRSSATAMPEHGFHRACPQLVVLPAAVMSRAPGGACGGRILVEVPGPSGSAALVFARVLGQRREEPQAIGVGAGEVLLADVTGAGEHGAQLRADPGLGQLLAAGVQERVEQGAVNRVPGQHRARDDLVRGDDELAVVPGHVAFLVAHYPHVRVGGIRPRLGTGPVRARRLTGRAASPAAFPGGRGCVPGFLLRPLRLAAGLVPGRQPVPCPGQPLPPLSPAGQRPRGRRLRAAAFPGVFGGVSPGRLGKYLLDLRQRPVRLLRRVAGQLGAIQAERAQRHHALRGQQP
jgi:hypothetical protein